MKLAALPAFVLAGLALSGCDARQVQRVAVVVARGELPVSGIEVRLYRLQQCQGSYEHRTLGTDGTAVFARKVELGTIDVITDELSVCAEIDGVWRPLFSSLHGPAPSRIDISCDLSKTDLECASRFDGRPIDEPVRDEDDA